MKAKDLLGCVVWAAFLLLAMIWVPLLGPFLSLLTPLPFDYYAVKLGIREGAKLAGLAVLAIGIAAKLGGFSQVFLFALEFSGLGIVLAVNLQTSFLTPPFGFSLFYLRGVTPEEVPTTSIYRGAVPFIGIQLMVLVALIWMARPV